MRRPRDEATLGIPWGNVRGFEEDPGRGAVRILVLGMRPSGEIVFVPEGAMEPLVAALLG